jgi:histidinol-phosphate aminotransferase
MAINLFSETLQSIGSRIAPRDIPVSVYLDKNEQTEDLDSDIKNEVLDELFNTYWNRYPRLDSSEIENLIAGYCKLNPSNIAIAPGAAYLITTLLNYFAINKKHIVIAQPSYTLFDFHCKTYNIAYEPWYLKHNLEFDLEYMPKLTANSVLFMASPNNPVGNIISNMELESILQNNKESLVILDSVYLEFSSANPTQLVQKYNNLIVLRSFSKAFPGAGLRLGYMCAHQSLTSVIKKLILLFSVNHFSMAYAKVVLNNPSHLLNMENRVHKIINERDHLFSKLTFLFNENTIQVKRSEGNFLLIRIPDDKKLVSVLKALGNEGIQILNTSNLKMLDNTLRISVGSTKENNLFINCIKTALS